MPIRPVVLFFYTPRSYEGGAPKRVCSEWVSRALGMSSSEMRVCGSGVYLYTFEQRSICPYLFKDWFIFDLSATCLCIMDTPLALTYVKL